MRILVTGGAGYIGTRLVHRLLREGHDVTVLDLLTYGCYLQNPNPRCSLKICKGDIRDSKIVKKALEDVGIVYHLAAMSNDPTGNLNPELTRDINYAGTELLLEACGNEGVRQFIFASSSSVFGIQEGENVTEDCTPNPITPYSKAKLEAELAVLNTSLGFITTAIRPATVCGVSPRQRFDLVVNALCGSAFFDHKLTVYGGTQRRPNLTMTDMIEIYVTLLSLPANYIDKQVFNAGWENCTILELAQMVQNFFVNCSITVEHTDDIRDYHICSEKIERLLSYQPRATVNNAIPELIVAMSQGFMEHYKSSQYNNLAKLKELDENNNVSR